MVGVSDQGWPARSAPTINDVARVAGVSRGTVSRVLNGAHYVSPAALKAVRSAMRTTGYVVNQSARSLATRRTNCYAFVLSEPQEHLFEDPNVATLLRSTTQQLAESDLTVVVMICVTDSDHERVLRYIRAGHVDGVMLVSTHANDPLLDAVASIGIPAVRCGFPAGGVSAVPSVSADDRTGGQLMTRHLMSRGRRHIGLVTGPLDAPGSIERRQGWLDALGSSAEPDLAVAADDYSHLAGRQATQALVERHPEIDALFAGSDLLASGALVAIRAAGLTVPEDIAVGGFDDSRIATALEPALTTVRQPLDRIGHELARLVVRRAAGDPPVSLVLPVELVVRDST
jgi:DNA-binding LacI/PurR family transcriptional regulator